MDTECEIRDLKQRVSNIENQMKSILTKEQADSLLRELSNLRDEAGTLDDLHLHTEDRLQRTRELVGGIDVKQQVERLEQLETRMNYIDQVMLAMAGVIINQLGNSYYVDQKHTTIGQHVRQLVVDYGNYQQKQLGDKDSESNT